MRWPNSARLQSRLLASRAVLNQFPESVHVAMTRESEPRGQDTELVEQRGWVGPHFFVQVVEEDFQAQAVLVVLEHLSGKFVLASREVGRARCENVPK